MDKQESNSHAEVVSLLTRYYEANKNKNLASRNEAKLREELFKFVDGGTNTIEIDVEGKQVSMFYGDAPSYTNTINPRKLYDYAKKLSMEDKFWELVTVPKTKASEWLSENQLAKLYDTTETVKWTVRTNK